MDMEKLENQYYQQKVKLFKLYMKKKEWLERVDKWRNKYKDHEGYRSNHPEELKFKDMWERVEKKRLHYIKNVKLIAAKITVLKEFELM